jgi:hypothetical protein
MSTQNPYAPPKAVVGDVIDAEVAPALWNPTAAGSWSILFSPIFGAYLHMLNWRALGQPEKAAASKKWFVGSIAFIVAITVAAIFMPESKGFEVLARLGGLVLLIVWYYTIGKSQQTYVASRFGKQYPRRGWAVPLLCALGIFVGVMVAVFVVALIAAIVSGAG